MKQYSVRDKVLFLWIAVAQFNGYRTVIGRDVELGALVRFPGLGGGRYLPHAFKNGADLHAEASIGQIKSDMRVNKMSRP